MNLRRAHFETRYLVLNTAASTLALDDAELLAIAAVRVDNSQLRSRHCFHYPLGRDPAQDSAAFSALRELASDSVLVVFNAAFNRQLIEDGLQRHLPNAAGWAKTRPWLDLYFLLPALFPGHRGDPPARLQRWLERFGIPPLALPTQARALSDAWAIAQLLLAAQARASELGAHTPQTLLDAERVHRQYRKRL